MYDCFVAMLRERLPNQALDWGNTTAAEREFFLENLCPYVGGQYLYATRQGFVGVGSGLTRTGDSVMVPLDVRHQS